MSDRASQAFQVTPAQANQTLAALLRQWLPGQSWSQVRQLVAARRVRLNGEVWLDPAPPLKERDAVRLPGPPAPAPRRGGPGQPRPPGGHPVLGEKAARRSPPAPPPGRPAH